MTFAIYIFLSLGLLTAILNVLPVAGPSLAAFFESMVLVFGYMKAWNFLLPISEMFICLGVVIAYEVGVWGVHALLAAYKWVRGMSTN